MIVFGSLWEVIRNECGALMKNALVLTGCSPLGLRVGHDWSDLTCTHMHALIGGDHRASLLSAHHLEIQEKLAVCSLAVGSHQNSVNMGILILTFQSPELLEINVWCLQITQPMVLCGSSLKWLSRSLFYIPIPSADPKAYCSVDFKLLCVAMN